MFIQQKMAELEAFMKKWKQELYEGLGVSQLPNASIGISFEPEVQLAALPEAPVLSERFYVMRSDVTFKVELLNRNSLTGLVTFEVLDDKHETSMMLASVFDRIFTPAP